MGLQAAQDRIERDGRSQLRRRRGLRLLRWHIPVRTARGHGVRALLTLQLAQSGFLSVLAGLDAGSNQALRCRNFPVVVGHGYHAPVWGTDLEHALAATAVLT